MKKLTLEIFLILLFINSPILAAEKNEDQNRKVFSAENEIRSRVQLLNDIIKDPEAANMRNWKSLANPHDETELMFFMNSISDGTLKSYKPDSFSEKRLIAHSRSDSDKSVALQYLRLSLMAYCRRPDIVSPQFKIVNISKIKNVESTGWLFVGIGHFIANDASGHSI
jgi:hypothetical protein